MFVRRGGPQISGDFQEVWNQNFGPVLDYLPLKEDKDHGSIEHGEAHQQSPFDSRSAGDADAGPQDGGAPTLEEDDADGVRDPC